MTNVLTKLEPRIEHKGTILFEELDEVNEALFISKGIVDVGFKINNFPKYVIRFSDQIMPGAYNCTFSIRTSALYVCKTTCEGYSIRRNEWLNIMNLDIADDFKKNIKIYYFNKIYRHIESAK